MDQVISSSTYGFLRLILSKVRDCRIEIRINIVQLFRSNCLQLRLLLTCANREVARRELVNVDYDAFMWLAVRYHVSCLSWRAIDKVKLFNTRIQILSQSICMEQLEIKALYLDKRYLYHISFFSQQQRFREIIIPNNYFFF